ncbi:AVO2 [Candida oxycetoniae]|uniref:AVO2 n=1 Tax=Candida oxycetoniae TaxID=497107 RepID=A0AAI9WWN5_9ASCO|nr:AVO2 [Candida oxycetoniae]KAI3403128.2 AVO2 [Candida oxycetoniae]
MLDPSSRLRNAVIEGNLPIVKRILSRFPELWLNLDSNHKGWSNLHYSSYYGHYLICFHLIAFINKTLGELSNAYTELDLLTFDNITVLHLCMEKHHSQTLHYLLQEFPGRLWLNFPAEKTLSSLENTRNKQDWLAKDYASSFDLIKEYEKMKKDILHHDYSTLPPGFIDPSSFINDSETSFEAENKVLSSPFVSMTMQSIDEDAKNGRKHANSLPSNRKLSSNSVPNGRNRSHTSYSNKHPVGLTISTGTDKPTLPSSKSYFNFQSPVIAPLTPLTTQQQQPSIHKTHSLKSVTISPSVRGAVFTSNNLEDEPSSPQSILSSASSYTISPNSKSNTRKKSYSFSRGASLPAIASGNMHWPLVEKKPASEEPERSSSAVSRPSHEFRSRRNSSTSSIAAKVAFNSSRSSLNQQESPRKLKPNKTQNAKSNSINSTSSTGSMSSYNSGPNSVDASPSVGTETSESFQNAPGEQSSMPTTAITNSSSSSNSNNNILRKSRSSGTLASQENARSVMYQNRSANLSMASINSNSHEGLRKYTVNSISFSRVR